MFWLIWQDKNARENNPAIVPPRGLEFQIKDTKVYVLVVTLSTENDEKLLEQLKSGFKITIKWNKYRSQMTIQNNNNNLNCLIGPIFTKVNRLFVLPFERIEENNVKKDYRNSFSHYYVLNNLLDFAYFKENYRLIAIDLSKQTKLKDPQQINFTGKLEDQNNGATMLFIIEKSEETTFEFLQNSVNIL